MIATTILVLGGYGNFGKRIVENLAQLPNLNLLIAGRNLAKANKLVNRLQEFQHIPQKIAVKLGENTVLSAIYLDIFSVEFEGIFRELAPSIVIHTSGPFQGQDYHVAKLCLANGAHYVDLADDRRFVCDIGSLSAKAVKNNVVVVSGASSVPGLSSAVVDQYQDDFSVIESIDIAIAPGNKAERGEATVKAILSYTGHPITVFSEGRWQSVYGWMDARLVDFGDIVGKRWLANVDVPDLELFPKRYNVTDGVGFHAGLELPLLHWSMVGMAYLVKKGVVKNWAPMAKPIKSVSNAFISLGSDKGAMRVFITGLDKANNPKKILWSLYAPHGIGPYIPTLSTIIVVKKLLQSDSPINSGASPCVGLLSLDDFTSYFDSLGIYHIGEEIG